MSSLLPSFFNRIDFWAMLLPGYVTIILGLFLFSPSNLYSITGETAFNLFAAIVFLVAGPALGFTLTLSTQLFVNLLWNSKKYEIMREYSLVRMESQENRNIEFDNIDARITFSRSTGCGLGIIALISILWQPDLYPIPGFLSNDLLRYFISGLIYWTGISLMIGSVYETINVQHYIICKFIKGKTNESLYDDLCGYICDDERRKNHLKKSRNKLLIGAAIVFLLSILFSLLLCCIIPYP